MNIQPIEDKNSRFDLVELKQDKLESRPTPHCKLHGAMNKVSLFKEGTGGFWRCLRSESLTQGKTYNDCRAGCIETGE